MKRMRSRARATRSVIGKAIAVIAMLAIVAGVVAYKASFLDALATDPFFVGYGLAVTGYILSRFLFGSFYRTARDTGHEPHVSIVVAGFNEEDAIGRTLEALLELDYPREKVEIVAVNDGSTDATAEEMLAVAARDPRIRVIDFPENWGKRAAMEAGIRASSGEIVAFVDSDSILRRDALRNIVQPFVNEKVGAVAGHADVENAGASLMTKMQAVRYFVAFRVVKAAESIFGAVLCCSGCFSAYRRSAIEPHLDRWRNQKFLGKKATYGDDRALTNFVLRDWKVTYQANAVSSTLVPEGFRQFLRQQMRWKRSWTRETPIVSRFMWRKNPLASLSVYVGIALTLVGPVAAGRAMAWRPLETGTVPYVYLAGMAAMALLYGLYYAVRKGADGGLWVYGIAFVFFYLACLIWQTYIALLTARESKWGTRPSEHLDQEACTTPARMLRPGLPYPPPRTAHWRTQVGVASHGRLAQPITAMLDPS